MRLKKSLHFSGIIIILLWLLVSGCTKKDISEVKESFILWEINNLDSIGGNSIEILGNPRLIDLSGNKAVEFNGKDDGILININPIYKAKAFSIEVVFKPYDVFADNIEQRFLHIQDPVNDKRRILIELRLNSRKEWFPDFYMRTEKASLTLVDSTKTYPVNQWAVITLAYKNSQLRGFVNGKEVLSGNIEYLPIGENAKTSLGTRMDKRSWFNGAIKAVTFHLEK